MADTMRYWPGTLTSQIAVRLADARSESAGESLARHQFRQLGLPAPVLQLEVRDDAGRLLGRVDFAWPDAMIVAEYDSIAWHVGPEALLHDRLKTARLQECGWTTIPMTVDDIRHHPNGLIARIDSHLARPRIAS